MSDAPRLRQLQAQMHAVLRGEQTPAALAEAWQVPPERIAIYAQFVAAHVRTVLDKDFACLASVLGASWHEVASAYVRDVPATHYELNEAGRAFPAFLRKHAAQLGVGPAHLELAELEWLDWDVYRDKAADLPSRPLAFDAQTPLTLAANPTLQIVETTYQAHLALAQFVARQACELATTPTPPVAVALYRHPAKLSSTVRALDQLDLFALMIAKERLTLRQAADGAALDLAAATELLAEAVERGIVAVVEAAAT